MSNLWMRIRIWTKLVLFAVALIYLLLFVGYNAGKATTVWVFPGQELNVAILVLLFFTFVLGVLITLLVRMALRTVRQIREYRDRSRTQRLEKEMADMKAKAAMLHTKTSPPEKPQ